MCVSPLTVPIHALLTKTVYGSLDHSEKIALPELFVVWTASDVPDASVDFNEMMIHCLPNHCFTASVAQTTLRCEFLMDTYSHSQMNMHISTALKLACFG